MSESIHEVTNTMSRKIEDNSQYYLQRLDTALRDVHERIDVVSEAVNARVVKVSEETTITPDSDDVHEIKGAEFVTQRASGVPGYAGDQPFRDIPEKPFRAIPETPFRDIPESTPDSRRPVLSC
jgi:hypothetical protein